MKYYDDCFSGSDALAWVHDFLKLNPNFGQNISRTQAKLLCQKLLQRNVFENVVGQFKSTKPVFEESHLYSFTRGVLREARAGGSDLKENVDSFKVEKIKNKGSTLKRHSSFSDRLHLIRRPFGDRNGLQNIPKEFENENNPKQIRSKSSRCSLRQSVSNEKGGLVLQNIGTVKTNPEKSHVGLRGKHSRKGVSGLTRKWKSEYGISLMELNEETCDESATEVMNCDRQDQQEQSNDNTHQPTTSNIHEDNQGISNASNTEVPENICVGERRGESSENQVERTTDNHKDECCLQSDPNELWMIVCLER